MTRSVFLSSLLLVVSSCAAHHTGRRDGDSSPLHPLSDAFIAQVNEKASSWKAGRNFGAGLNMDYVKGLMGVSSEIGEEMKQFAGHGERLVGSKGEVLDQSEVNSDLPGYLPESFDARIEWPHCPSLNKISDQGGCGSDWAISIVDSMTDRLCIYKNKSIHYSVEDLLDCCGKHCGSCQGGNPFRAMQYWNSFGLVTGGPYGSNLGCKPYTFKPCADHLDDCEPITDTPKCVKKCDYSSGLIYRNDRHGVDGVIYVSGDVERVKRLIANGGPVASWFTVYEDFLHYKSGVYVHATGDEIGKHAVKVLGYGTENGIGYYLCANSWGDQWGDNGFFKISFADMEPHGVSGSPV